MPAGHLHRRLMGSGLGTWLEEATKVAGDPYFYYPLNDAGTWDNFDTASRPVNPPEEQMGNFTNDAYSFDNSGITPVHTDSSLLTAPLGSSYLVPDIEPTPACTVNISGGNTTYGPNFDNSGGVASATMLLWIAWKRLTNDNPIARNNVIMQWETAAPSTEDFHLNIIVNSSGVPSSWRLHEGYPIGGGPARLLGTGPGFAANTPYLLAVTQEYDTSDTTTKFYVNGIQIGTSWVITSRIGGLIEHSSSNGDIQLRPTAQGANHVGGQPEMAFAAWTFWDNYAMSAAEILSLYDKFSAA
jgi:hypothetical protein